MPRLLVSAAAVDHPAGKLVLPVVRLMMTPNLSFGVYALGKEGGSGQYHPCSPLTKTQWMVPLGRQPIVEPWSLESLEEMHCGNLKKGPQKLAGKAMPKTEHIEVVEYIGPLTHI